MARPKTPLSPNFTRYLDDLAGPRDRPLAELIAETNTIEDFNTIRQARGYRPLPPPTREQRRRWDAEAADLERVQEPEIAAWFREFVLEKGALWLRAALNHAKVETLSDFPKEMRWDILLGVLVIDIPPAAPSAPLA